MEALTRPARLLRDLSSGGRGELEAKSARRGARLPISGLAWAVVRVVGSRVYVIVA